MLFIKARRLTCRSFCGIVIKLLFINMLSFPLLLRSFMGFSLFVFDMDGTLLNTLENISACMNTVLERHGLETHPVEKYKAFIGSGMKKLIERAVGDERKDTAPIDLMMAEMAEIYSGQNSADTPPYEGIRELLSALMNKGKKLAIFSNKPDYFTKLNANVIFPEIKFDHIVGARNDLALKPSPQGLFEIMDKTNSEKQETILIGDMAADVLAAKNAGVKCAAALWGFTAKDVLMQYEPDYLIEKPLDLINLC